MGKYLKYIPGLLLIVFVLAMLAFTSVPILVLCNKSELVGANLFWFGWAVLLILTISAMYNDMVDDMSARVGHPVWPGRFKIPIFNISLIWILLCVVLSCFFSCVTPRVHNLIVTGTDARLLDYKEYYLATEAMLDSLGVDADNPILETDVGAKYLETKSVIDEHVPEK